MTNKRRDLRIIVSTNSTHSGSGYAVFQRDLLYRLAKENFEVAVSAFYGVDSYPVYLYGEDLIDDRFKGVKIKHYPKMVEPFGGDALVAHAVDFKAHVALSHQDVPTLQPQFLQQMRVWIPYTPIDMEPVPPMVLHNLQYAYKILTQAKFGHETLKKHGFYSTCIVEGTDVELFKPQDMLEARRKMGIAENIFLWGMIGANKENPPRKGYQQAIEAFALFHKKHPESRIFFHTQQISPGAFPIQQYLHHLGVSKAAIFLNPYKQTFNAGTKDIALELNALDALLHPSHTEGFGLLSIEAQACGKPVLLARSTSMPETVVEGKTGELAEISHKFWSNQNAYQFVPSVDSIVEKMELIYNKLKGKNTYQQDCREHIVTNFNIDTQFKEQWLPFFEALQDEIVPVPELTKATKPTNINPAP